MKPALLTPEAEADVEEAFEWYEAQRPGLGVTFRRALDVAVASIEDHPEAYAVIHRDTRRVLLPRFPYGLYYRVLDQNILVVALYARQASPEDVALSLRRANDEMQLTSARQPTTARACS